MTVAAEMLAFLNSPTLVLGPQLTAVLFLAFPPWRQWEEHGTWTDFIGRVYRLLLIVSLWVDAMVLSPWFWLCIASIHFAWIVKAYAIADNHRYLEGYWCLAIAVALMVGGPDGGRLLARNALLLIGLAFLCATVWKLASHRYRDGSFFTRILITDARFGAIAHLFGGLSAQRRAAHLSAIQRIRSGAATYEQVDVPSSLRRLALTLTWWTVVIEAVIAAAFVAPVDALQVWQLGLLLLFAVTTYVLVPVQTFGNILLLMLVVSADTAATRAVILGTLLGMTVATFLGGRLTLLYTRQRQQLLREMQTDNGANVPAGEMSVKSTSASAST
jgi:hypothetical protein